MNRSQKDSKVWRLHLLVYSPLEKDSPESSRITGIQKSQALLNISILKTSEFIMADDKHRKQIYTEMVQPLFGPSDPRFVLKLKCSSMSEVVENYIETWFIAANTVVWSQSCPQIFFRYDFPC